MNPFAIVSLIGLIVSVSVATAALIRNPRGDVNRLFTIICILITYASFTETGYRLATTPDSAAFWLKTQAFWPLVLAALAHFSLVFTSRTKLTGNRYALLGLYGPAIFFSFVDLFGGIFTVVPIQEHWGWHYDAAPGLITDIGAVWILCITIVPPLLTWRHFRRSQGTRRQQAMLVWLGFTIAAAIALGTSYLLLLLDVPFPSLTVTSFVIGGGFIMYAIWKYDLFALTAEAAAEGTLATMSDFMFIVTPQGEITRVNQSAASAVGCKANELVGTNIGAVLLPAQTAPVPAKPDPVHATPTVTMKDVEMALHGKGGQSIPVSVSASRVTDRGGVIRGFVYIARDITERRQAEEILWSLYERERALRQDLETEIKKRSDFARILVHELRTPLTAIVASSDLLADNLKPEFWTRIAHNIRRSALNLDNRITELLDMSQGEAGMIELKAAMVSPLEMLRETVESMTPVISSRKHSILLELPASLPDVYADHDRVQQVLFNLIDNAIKYSAENGKVTLRACVKGDSLVFSVEDTGRGIPAAEQAHLFDPYTRLESRGRKVGGMGLGLAICKILVELHGGHIWVDSEENKGSIFSFSIPLTAGSAAGGQTQSGPMRN